MCISDVVVNDKELKSENSLRAHLLDKVLAVLVEVVVGGLFLLLTHVFVDDFFFLFWCAALATASLCGRTILNVGLATTMLASKVQGAVFLSFSLVTPETKLFLKKVN